MFVYICCYGYRFVVSIVTFGDINNCVYFGHCVTLMDWIHIGYIFIIKCSVSDFLEKYDDIVSVYVVEKCRCYL